MANGGENEPASSGKYKLFDALAITLLSLATVGTAWCSYQATVWSAMSSQLTTKSSARANEVVAARIKANQMFLLDVLLLSQYLNARNASNQPLADMYVEQFNPEFKVAFSAWLRTRPFENPDAPPHAFVTNLYQPKLALQADEMEKERNRLWDEAQDSDRIARNYTLLTVLLAAALFFGGTAPQMRTPKGRRAILWLGLLVLFSAMIRLLRLPILP